MITSPANDRIKHVRRLQSDRRFRQRQGAFVVEGTRWFNELAPFADRVQLILYTKNWLETTELLDPFVLFSCPILPVSEAMMAAASDTQSPAGVLAVVAAQSLPLPPAPALLLILDQIGDPGNLGTMMRTAAAAGVDGLLLGPGCVDPTNPKVVRGSMGALLRLPVYQMDWGEIESVTEGLSVWLAAADGTESYTTVNWRRPSALIIGSEAGGAGDEARRLAAGRVYIPMHAGTESLNAAMAAGVILFEAVRQRVQ